MATTPAAPTPTEAERLLREASAGYVAMIADLFAGFNHLFGDFKRGNYFAAIREHPDMYLYVLFLKRKWFVTYVLYLFVQSIN